MRNPFARAHNPEEPRPGGTDGQVVDYVRWHPPDTPYRWGVGFDTPFSNVPNVNGGMWINQFLPTKNWFTPWGVDEIAYLFPSQVGRSGSWEQQLKGGPGQPAGPSMAVTMEELGRAQGQITGGVGDLAGSFARS